MDIIHISSMFVLMFFYFVPESTQEYNILLNCYVPLVSFNLWQFLIFFFFFYKLVKYPSICCCLIKFFLLDWDYKFGSWLPQMWCALFIPSHRISIISIRNFWYWKPWLSSLWLRNWYLPHFSTLKLFFLSIDYTWESCN